jgi:hypothetical protein
VVTSPSVSCERKSLRRLRWSLRLRHAAIWMVGVITVLAPVLLAIAVRSSHTTPRRSTDPSAVSSCVLCSRSGRGN